MVDSPPTAYLARFTALAPGELAGDAADRLREAMGTLPGIGAVHGATHDHGARTVTCEFLLSVQQGIADASRDASRLAREALKAADLADAQIVELWVALRIEPAA